MAWEKPVIVEPPAFDLHRDLEEEAGSHLIPLSLEELLAGAPQSSWFLALGNVLKQAKFLGLSAVSLPMLGLGGSLFTWMLFRFRLVPRAISVVGLIGNALVLFGSIAGWFGLVDVTPGSNGSLLAVPYDVTTGQKTTIVSLSSVKISDAQVSIDGQYALFVSQVSGRPRQMIRMDGQGLQTLYCPNNGIPPSLSDLLWSPNQQLAVFLRAIL
jgi:hypothetical protein